LNHPHGFDPEHLETLDQECQLEPFESLADLVRRTQLDRWRVETLVLAGALDYMGERAKALWDLAVADRLAQLSPPCHSVAPPRSARDL
jgi:DNA polymerase III alpha subunit